MKGSTARRVAAVVLACALALVFVSSAAAVPTVDGVFPVKGIDGNSKIVAGPDGNLWLTLANLAGNNVARISPAGEVTEFELGLSAASGIAVGPEGRLWVTAAETVASFAPLAPTVVAKTPINQIKDVSPIVAGPDGNMWVATKGEVLKFPPTTPAAKTDFLVPELSPKDIDTAGSVIVVADGNAGQKRIATFTTAGKETDFPIGNASQGVAGGPGGQFAYSSPDAKEAGLVTPPNPPKVTEVDGDPFGVALGSDGAYWFARSAKGGVARLTTSGEVTFLGGLPAKYFPRQITAGPNNTLWLTMEIPGENIYAVARISGLEPPVIPITAPAPAPETKIAKGPKKIVKTAGKRAKVKFRFTSTTAGATFQCALTKVKKVKKGKKAAKPQFKGCKSPKSYSLKPGKYRFSVRAVSAGVVDPSAATRSFRVVHVHKR